MARKGSERRKDFKILKLMERGSSSYLFTQSNWLSILVSTSYIHIVHRVWREVSTAWKVSEFGVILVRIFPHLGWIRNISSYSVQMRENVDQRNSADVHFLRTGVYLEFLPKKIEPHLKISVFTGNLKLPNNNCYQDFFQCKTPRKYLWFLRPLLILCGLNESNFCTHIYNMKVELRQIKMLIM